MQTIEFHSHEQQDEFIYNLFKGKKEGFFLDISCGHPIIGSNSYALEKFCGWRGFGFDIGNVEKDLQWSKHRTSPFVMMDATSPHLTNFLVANAPEVVDYVSLDVDAAGTNLALQALDRVLRSNIKIKAMTFEHECHIHGPRIRDAAIGLLEDRGMIPLFADVRLWSGGLADDSSFSFEDWWIDPQYFDEDILKIQDEGLYYFECIEKIKSALDNKYNRKHNCCRAWPEEYNLFWNENDEQQLKSLFKTMTQRSLNESF